MANRIEDVGGRQTLFLDTPTNAEGDLYLRKDQSGLISQLSNGAMIVIEQGEYHYIQFYLGDLEGIEVKPQGGIVKAEYIAQVGGSVVWDGTTLLDGTQTGHLASGYGPAKRGTYFQYQ